MINICFFSVVDGRCEREGEEGFGTIQKLLRFPLTSSPPHQQSSLRMECIEVAFRRRRRRRRGTFSSVSSANRRRHPLERNGSRSGFSLIFHMLPPRMGYRSVPNNLIAFHSAATIYGPPLFRKDREAAYERIYLGTAISRRGISAILSSASYLVECAAKWTFRISMRSRYNE